MHYLKGLYIFFIIVALNIFFFSTKNLNAKAFLIEDIEISQPFESNFDKNSLIYKGFENAFYELINSLVKSSDLKKINSVKVNEIKGMVDTFSIKEEKFINQIYHVSLGVSFDKKKVYDFLEKKNIFPTQIIDKTFLFVPIVIDQKGDDIKVFSDNPLYENWNKLEKPNYLIKYLLPTEDLEDFDLIKKNLSNIEKYDFKEIIEKYFLDHSIITLIFKNDEEIKILSKINIKDKVLIKNDSFKGIDVYNDDKLENLIDKLKIIYEDIWKEHNQINTSIKLPLMIQVNNQKLDISLKFEKVLNSIDLISDYSINKFNKDFIYYEIIFNGTPKNFINIMRNRNYNFNTQKKIWILNE